RPIGRPAHRCSRLRGGSVQRLQPRQDLFHSYRRDPQVPETAWLSLAFGRKTRPLNSLSLDFQLAMIKNTKFGCLEDLGMLSHQNERRNWLGSVGTAVILAALLAGAWVNLGPDLLSVLETPGSVMLPESPLTLD